jgi:hypothetical protein
MLGIKNSAFKYLKTKTYFGLAVGFNGNNIKFQFSGFYFLRLHLHRLKGALNNELRSYPTNLSE